MTPFSRRAFLQGSLAGGLVAAAEVAHGHWLLETAEPPIRVGVIGLDHCGLQQLAVFAAIPGVRVAGIVDPEPRRLRSAFQMLDDLQQDRPRVHEGLDSALDDPELDAIAISNSAPIARVALEQSLPRRRPIFTSLPPALDRASQRNVSAAIVSRSALVHFDVSDRLYPASPSDFSTWIHRAHPNPVEAQLLVSRATTKLDLRSAAIAATDAVFASIDTSPRDVLRWLESTRAQPTIINCGTLGILPVPPNVAGLKELRVSFLGAVRQKTTFKMQHRTGTLEVAVAKESGLDRSLASAMKFLHMVRHPEESNRAEGARTQLAAVLVDRFLTRLAEQGA